MLALFHGHNQGLFITKMSYRVKHTVNGILAHPRNSKTSKSNNIYIASDKNLAIKLSSESKKNLVAWNEVIAILLQIYTKAKMQVE